MSKIDASEINKDGTTIEDDGSGNLRQVSGTDGGGDATLPIDASDTSYDDSGNTHVQGANLQAAVDDIDAELVTVKNDIASLSPTTENYLYLSAAGAWASATNPAIVPMNMTINGVVHPTAQFVHSNESSIEWSFILPEDYDGNGFSGEIYFFTQTATGDDMLWEISALSYADAAAMSGTYGTAAIKQRTNTASETMQVTDIGVGGPKFVPSGGNSPGDFCQVKLTRQGDTVTDSLLFDVYLVMIKLFYTKA